MTGRTAAATAATVRRGQDARARALVAAGWVCIPPDDDRVILVTDEDHILCAELACAPMLPDGPHTATSLYELVCSMIAHLDGAHGWTDPLTDRRATA